MLIIGWPASGAAGEASVLGDLLTLGAAITWGVWTILAGPILQRLGTLAGTFWIMLTGTIGLVPFALPGLVAQDWALPWWTYAGILYAGTASGALGRCSGSRPCGAWAPRAPQSMPTWRRSSPCWRPRFCSGTNSL